MREFVLDPVSGLGVGRFVDRDADRTRRIRMPADPAQERPGHVLHPQARRPQGAATMPAHELAPGPRPVVGLERRRAPADRSRDRVVHDGIRAVDDRRPGRARPEAEVHIFRVDVVPGIEPPESLPQIGPDGQRTAGDPIRLPWRVGARINRTADRAMAHVPGAGAEDSPPIPDPARLVGEDDPRRSQSDPRPRRGRGPRARPVRSWCRC